MKGCVFCDIIDGVAPAVTIKEVPFAKIIEPLGPHAPGHVLVIPRMHLEHAGADAPATGRLFHIAARYAEDHHDAYNLLTSRGAAATQTVGHLHVHVIPRGPDDGLDADWPWMRGSS